MAIVEESQFSLAIGKQGQNVRLANRLCDWNIDVKTVEQAAEMDLSEVATAQAAMNLFKDDESYDEITTVAELPGISQRVAELLKSGGIEDIEQFMEAYDNGAAEKIEGLTAEEIDNVYELIKDNVEFVEEQDEEVESSEEVEDSTEEDEEEKYYCPECGAEITLDMTQCPKCGVEFEFTEDEE